MDEGQLHSFEVLQILKGDLDPLNLYMDEVAYTNLDYKMVDMQDPCIGKLIKIQQLGVQYLKYKLTLNQRKAHLLGDYSQSEL